MTIKSLVLSLFLGIAILTALIIAFADQPLAFLNLPGLALVFGGTMIATLLSYSRETVKKAFKAVRKSLKKAPAINFHARLEIYTSAIAALKNGNIREAEQRIKKIHSPFFRRAAEMMVDGIAIPDILKVLDWHMDKVRTEQRTHVAVFLTMANYAPAFGMVGTLFGLVNMLGSMTSGDFQHIGGHMAIALMTTFYGLLFANILFKPLAVKLEQTMREDAISLAMAKEAVTFLSEGKTPTYTKEVLKKYIEKVPTN